MTDEETTAARRKRAPKFTDRDRLILALRHFGLTLADVEFDHNPGLWLREWDEEKRDFIPPARSLEHASMLIKKGVGGHDEKTFGRSGEKTVCTAGSDVGNRAKTRRLKANPPGGEEFRQEQFRRKLLAPDEKTEATPRRQKPKRKIQSRVNAWPKRKLRQRGKQ